MRAHLIKDGVVVNTIMVDSLDDFPNLIDADTGSIGDLWDGKKLTKPEPVPEPLVEPLVETTQKA